MKRECSIRSGTQVLILFFILAVQGCVHRRDRTPLPPGPKRVVIDKTVQKLTAFEGELQVMESKVSTGKAGHRTPSGNFKAASKSLMHYSSLYENAPMPYSVQVNGNYFIHGYSSVPNFPASHGCIRMPLVGDNAAKRFYEWVEIGTPISLVGDWAGTPATPAAASKRTARPRLKGTTLKSGATHGE